MVFTFGKKSKNINTSLTETFSKNFENNSQVVKKSLIFTKKIIPPMSKVMDYSIIVILTFFASKYYLNIYNKNNLNNIYNYNIIVIILLYL